MTRALASVEYAIDVAWKRKAPWSARFVIAALALCVSACGGGVKLMREIPANTAMEPLDGNALIVFFRLPSDLTITNYSRSSVFEIKKSASDPQLIGILSADPKTGTKVAYRVEPGKHLFMVVGENADFLDADVLPNKTYYLAVTLKPGKYKANFTLKAMTPQGQTVNLNEMLAACVWTEKTAAADLWLNENLTSIRTKQAREFSLWTQSPESERPGLRRDEGVAARPQ